jgi:hypothetical protein
MQIKRPDVIKVFGKDAMQGDYLPVRFGTNVVVAKESFEDIANKNFEYGLESLEGDLQLKDLNTVFFYQGALLKYLFQKGIPEFSAYENYEAGAVVQKDGVVWVATKAIEASLHKKEANPCDPCGCKTECENPVYPSKEAGWCKFITSCEYDAKIKELEAKDKALEKAINDLKGVEGFSVVPNAKTGAFELQLNLSDGSTIAIPMTKFGHITKEADGSLTIVNADTSKIVLPKFVAEKDLDQQKGFYFNAQSGKWEVDLRDLVKDGSGLQVDREGYVSVKPADFTDNETLEVLPTGKVAVAKEWLNKFLEALLNPLKSYIKRQKDVNADALDKAIRNLEAAQKAYVNEKAREAEVMARGNYAEIKAYKENLDKLRQQVGRHENDLGNQANQLKALGLADEEILALIQAGMNKANLNYIIKIEPVKDGVKVTYANGTTSILGGNSVAVDGKTIVGNGKDKVLSTQISKRTDNKLSVVDDGLYVGFQHSHTFYVSSSLGNDTNIGSRDKPLATITEGLSRIQDGDKVMFRLYESDVHDWKKSLSSHDDIQLTIEPYGPTTEAVFAENVVNSAAWLRSKELKKPTIRMICDELSFGQARGAFLANFTKLCYIQGVKIEVVEPHGKPIHGIFGFSEGNVKMHFRGCEIKCGTGGFIQIGSFDNMIILDRTVVDYSKGAFVYVESQGQLHIGHRFENTEPNTAMLGKTSRNTDTTLHWNERTLLADIIAHGVSGKTSAQSYGVMY